MLFLFFFNTQNSPKCGH